MGGGGVLEESPERLLQVRPLYEGLLSKLSQPAKRSEKSSGR